MPDGGVGLFGRLSAAPPCIRPCCRMGRIACIGVCERTAGMLGCVGFKEYKSQFCTALLTKLLHAATITGPDKWGVCAVLCCAVLCCAVLCCAGPVGSCSRSTPTLQTQCRSTKMCAARKALASTAAHSTSLQVGHSTVHIGQLQPYGAMVLLESLLGLIVVLVIGHGDWYSTARTSAPVLQTASCSCACAVVHTCTTAAARTCSTIHTSKAVPGLVQPLVNGWRCKAPDC